MKGTEALSASLPIASYECEVCGATEDLRIAPLMTGDKFGEPAKHPVCTPCFRAWYDSGATTREGILAYREKTAA